MQHSAWEPVIRWGVWLVIMAIVMGALGRSRLKQRPPSESDELRQPVAILWVGVVCTLMFGAFGVLSQFTGKGATWWTTLIFVGFALLGVVVIADYYLARHTISEQGLAYGGLRGRRGNMRWDEVRSIRYASTMKWFRLEDVHGNVARLSAMLIGLPEFARLALDQVPSDAVDDFTWDLLDQTASGNPPPVW